MPLRPSALLATVLLGALLVACGDNDGASPTPAPATATPAITASGQAGPAATVTPGSNGDEKTPAPDEETPTNDIPATAPGETPTPGPTAAQGTPAVEISEEAFLAMFAGQSPENVTCFYDPGSALTTCPGAGEYAIDPPIVGQDVTCNLWLLESAPTALQCNVVQPPETKYYEVQ
jgi:hypothetical protein